MLRLLALSGLLLLGSCAPLPHGTVGAGLAVRWLPSPNYDERRPNFVIIHQTSNDDAERALRTLTDPDRKVSAHYMVGRDGTLHQLVDERARAWHAGESSWGSLTDLNSASIGIELDNTGDEPFAEAQIAALLQLLADIKARHRIPDANFLGHGDVAPGRKVDPSRHFPWQRLARHGFGMWCDAPAPAPPDFDAQRGLQALGYAVGAGDTALHAIRAFRRHWAGDDESAALSDADRTMLYCLLRLKVGGAGATQPR